jgi:hypothetical protein
MSPSIPFAGHRVRMVEYLRQEILIVDVETPLLLVAFQISLQR